MSNKYKEYDCSSRDEYLEYLAEEFCVDIETVNALADMLGPNEDFDGLINAIEEL